jgi:hypothetical protein
VDPTCQSSRAAPGPLGSAPLPRGHHAQRRCSGLKPMSGQRAARPDSCLARAAPNSLASLAHPTVPPRPPDSAASPLAPRPDRRLTRATVVPIARAPIAMVRSRVSRTAAARHAAPAVARHHLRAGEPPSPLSPVHVGRADTACVGHAHCASGPSANSAQCTRLNFIDF